MILSRIWYVILALFLAAAYYVVALAVGQYNRRNQVAMQEELNADSQVVSWALQVDARRRLDVLLLAAVDPTIGKSLRAVNGKELPIATSAKQDGQSSLKAFNDKLPPEYKADAVFLVDREGRLVAQTGYDVVAGYPEFELGGYPAVFDALHGFLRDDTWVWGGKIARVVTRPVEDEVGQPPLGAVIALRWVDTSFAKDLGKRTHTSLAFFALGARVSSAAMPDSGIDDATLEGLVPDAKTLEANRSDVKPLDNDKGGVLYVRIPGDTWELGGAFAVARPKVAINSPQGFISGADDTDKHNVVKWPIAVIALVAAGLGLLFSFLEHTVPLKAFAREGDSLKVGKTDAIQLPKVRGGYRAIAADINAGIQRIIEKGGGAGRKPADLESILGPVPAQPNMSAFTFPLNDPSAAPHIPNVPPGTGNRPGFQPPGQVPAAPGSRPQVGGAPAPPPPFNSNVGEGTMNMRPPGQPAPPTALSNNYAPTPGNPHSATVAASPAAAAKLAPPPPFNPPPPAKQAADGEDHTRVVPPASDLIAQSSAVPAVPSGGDPIAEWQKVYEDFIRTKKECGEPTDGLTFEKFQGTLKKNRDALMQRHGCKRVKFSVYVKEGRASLKATPVRD